MCARKYIGIISASFNYVDGTFGRKSTRRARVPRPLRLCVYEYYMCEYVYIYSIHIRTEYLAGNACVINTTRSRSNETIILHAHMCYLYVYVYVYVLWYMRSIF